MNNPIARLRALTPAQRTKAALLCGWFFLMITTLWLLKPVRSATLLTHLGSEELPYVRLGAVAAVAVVVGVYSYVVNRLSRLNVARGASFLFAGVLVLFWIALTIGGSALGAQRWFVWAVFILVDVYSTVMIAIFWTYANDVVSRDEADQLYGPIGVGGIVGGIAGGVLVDGLIGAMGAVNILLLCAALGIACGALVWASERILRPRERIIDRSKERGISAALEGGREVFHSRYLLLIVGVVLGYEFAAAMTDFVVNVVFERSFHSELELAQMFGRLGWIVSATALASQIFVVPLLLPSKRIALLVPPIAMALAAIGLTIAPIVVMAILMSAADRGLNYSLQQATKETLYVPLNDVQRYKGKAFIDMLVDRSGKAFSALALIAVIASQGATITLSLVIAIGALALWALCAMALGRAYARHHGERARAAPKEPALDQRSSART
jgi:AAA family ATP:ADP antiporter